MDVKVERHTDNLGVSVDGIRVAGIYHSDILIADDDDATIVSVSHEVFEQIIKAYQEYIKPQ